MRPAGAGARPPRRPGAGGASCVAVATFGHTAALRAPRSCVVVCWGTRFAGVCALRDAPVGGSCRVMQVCRRCEAALCALAGFSATKTPRPRWIGTPHVSIQPARRECAN